MRHLTAKTKFPFWNTLSLTFLLIAFEIRTLKSHLEGG